MIDLASAISGRGENAIPGSSSRPTQRRRSTLAAARHIRHDGSETNPADDFALVAASSGAWMIACVINVDRHEGEENEGDLQYTIAPILGEPVLGKVPTTMYDLILVLISKLEQLCRIGVSAHASMDRIMSMC